MECATYRVAIPPQLRNRRSIAGAVHALLFDVANDVSSCSSISAVKGTSRGCSNAHMKEVVEH